MKRTFLGFIALVALAACNHSVDVQDNRSNELTSTVAAGGDNEAELKKEAERLFKEEEERLKQENASLTTMEFDKLHHDFGDVKPESENSTTFLVKNTGNKPLIIEEVQASCGCTTPQKPEKPIAPGASDKIKVTFKSKPGQMGEQRKTVTVTANISGRTATVDIRANVVELGE